MSNKTFSKTLKKQFGSRVMTRRKGTETNNTLLFNLEDENDSGKRLAANNQKLSEVIYDK